uniref:NADH-ubiquinone oxidoreductase chain 4 n=1 Tax=Curculionidae sp. BMNH 1274272 TaxID=1796500 RepID=A0A126TF03_9CUCU|nr:NADH dehydrogenase subunit 4 [Curculionidae sp. BMNH 1274272]
MMVLMGLMFMIPLCFLSNFWFILIFLSGLMFLYFLKNFSFNYEMLALSYDLGVDLLTFVMVFLSFWICFLMVLASENLFKENFYWQMFLLMVMVLLISLYITFSSLNFFFFYLFFEVSLIPTLFLIIGWGGQPERLQAGMYLLFYTLLVSLPLMVSLFFLYQKFSTLNFYFFNSINSVLLYMCTNMVFFVKIPMFFIHLWLPKAHVEAPISGSMILAGIMLKLGGYGLMRVMVLFLEVGMKVNIIIICISLIGGLIISLMCLRQSDMKMLIAYSSVSHMGLVLAGIMSLNLWGMWGSLVLMLAHGLCSSGLFCLANLSYERTFSRSIYLNKGLINIMPNLSLWWFLLSSSNMAAPPSLNLLGEVLLINSLILYSKMFMILLFLMAIFSAGYSLFLYSYTQHGKIYSGLFSIFQINMREYLLVFLHWVPLNLLILKSEWMILWV